MPYRKLETQQGTAGHDVGGKACSRVFGATYDGIITNEQSRKERNANTPAAAKGHQPENAEQCTNRALHALA